MTVLSTTRETDTAMAETFRVVERDELRNSSFSELVAPVSEAKSDTIGEDVKMLTVRRNVGVAVQRYAVSGAAFGVSVDQAARASAIINGRYSAILAQYTDLLGLGWQGAAVGLAQAFTGNQRRDPCRIWRQGHERIPAVCRGRCE